MSSGDINRHPKAPPLWTTLLRPAVCPRSGVLDLITPELTLHIITILPGSLVQGLGPPRIIRYDLPEMLLRNRRPEFEDPTFLRIRQWEEPGSNEHDPWQYWLLLSDDNFTMFICADLGNSKPIAVDVYNCHAEVKGQRRIPDIIGADFVSADFFKPPWALLTFGRDTEFMTTKLAPNQDGTWKPNGSIAQIEGAQIKETGFTCYAESPDSVHWAFLAHTEVKAQDGKIKNQDGLLVYHKQPAKFVSFKLPTKAAQGCYRWRKPRVLFFPCQGVRLSKLDIGVELFKQAEIDYGPGNEPWVSNMRWLRRGYQDYIVLDLGQTGVSLIRTKDVALSKGVEKIHEHYSFAHPDKIFHNVTVLWAQEHRHPGGFIRIGSVHLAETFTVVEDVRVNADASYVATKISRLRQAVNIWRTSFKDSPRGQSPGWMLHFDHHVVQMLFHPHDPSWLVILTSEPKPTVYLWHNTELMPGIMRISLPHGEETGEIIGAWLEPLVEQGDRPLLVASPTSFDIGVVRFRGYGMPYFQSIMGLATLLPAAISLPVAAAVAWAQGTRTMFGGELKRKREDDGEDAGV